MGLWWGDPNDIEGPLTPIEDCLKLSLWFLLFGPTSFSMFLSSPSLQRLKTKLLRPTSLPLSLPVSLLPFPPKLWFCPWPSPRLMLDLLLQKELGLLPGLFQGSLDHLHFLWWVYCIRSVNDSSGTSCFKRISGAAFRVQLKLPTLVNPWWSF